jgi:Ni/Co efflux regulator RcnB
MKKLLNFGMAAMMAGVCTLTLQAAQFGAIQKAAKEAQEKKAQEEQAQRDRDAQRDAQIAREAQAARDASRDSRGDRVCIFEDVRFEGWSQCFMPGDQITDLKGHNNRISSVRVFGRANVSLYDEKNYRGHELQLTNDVSDLATRNMQRSGALLANWDNHVQSLRVGFDRNGNTSTQNRRDPRDGICVYDRVSYQGRSQCWESGDNLPDLTRSGADWSDRLSSIRVFGRASADLFSEISYRGERLTVDRDISDLSQYRLGPNNNGRGNGNGNANGNGNGNGRGRGNSADRGNGRGNRSWNDQVSSLRVLGRRTADNRR